MLYPQTSRNNTSQQYIFNKPISRCVQRTDNRVCRHSLLIQLYEIYYLLMFALSFSLLQFNCCFWIRLLSFSGPLMAKRMTKVRWFRGKFFLVFLVFHCHLFSPFALPIQSFFRPHSYPISILGTCPSRWCHHTHHTAIYLSVVFCAFERSVSDKNQWYANTTIMQLDEQAFFSSSSLPFFFPAIASWVTENTEIAFIQPPWMKFHQFYFERFWLGIFVDAFVIIVRFS